MASGSTRTLGSGEPAFQEAAPAGSDGQPARRQRQRLRQRPVLRCALLATCSREPTRDGCQPRRCKGHPGCLPQCPPHLCPRLTLCSAAQTCLPDRMPDRMPPLLGSRSPRSTMTSWRASCRPQSGKSGGKQGFCKHCFDRFTITLHVFEATTHAAHAAHSLISLTNLTLSQQAHFS